MPMATMRSIACLSSMQTRSCPTTSMLTGRMTMATSLECRVSLLDHEMVELAARIGAKSGFPAGKLNHVMKRAPADALPPEILNWKKRRFGMPTGASSKHELAPYAAARFQRRRSPCAGCSGTTGGAAVDRRAPDEPHRRRGSAAGTGQSRNLEPRLSRRPLGRGCASELRGWLHKSCVFRRNRILQV
jgi:asparagine synthetase B (glutamine-hydrolysing)